MPSDRDQPLEGVVSDTVDEEGYRPVQIRLDADPDDSGRRPLLDDNEIAALARYGSEQEISEGEVLFAEGDPRYDLIVVLEGSIELVAWKGKRGKEQRIVEYGPREFMGEIGMLTGQRVFVTAIVTGSGRVLRVPIDRVRELMGQNQHLSELILRAFLLRHARVVELGSGPKLIGSRYDPETRRLLEVLARNRIASRWLELEALDDAPALLAKLEIPEGSLPTVYLPGGELLSNPTNRELLDAVGIASSADEPKPKEGFDLIVVGAGPAGLAAAVYGASEGLRTMLVEDTSVGGQAGTSSRIENYLGFPAGLSGEELAARGALQARKFGVRIELGAEAVALEQEPDGRHLVRFAGNHEVRTRALIVATGARYNRLPLDRLEKYEGMGVYYAATQMEALRCVGKPVVVVGGGNSAGQAALFLARSCSEVHVAIRRDQIEDTMSHYLLDEIAAEPRIKVHRRTEVTRLIGDGELTGVELTHNETGERSEQSVSGLFVFIGAAPCTEWIGDQLAADEHGFLLTGAEVPGSEREGGVETMTLETSRPGVFCVGDARSSSIKRVSAAIGEGSMAVRVAFERLAAQDAELAPATGQA